MPFPTTPSQFETYIDPGSKREWIWDGRKWILIDGSLYQSKGLQGPLGQVGATGPQGATGPIGVQGELGAEGKQGERGRKGATGVQGERGPAGIQGGALCSLVVEPPSGGSVRGALYLSSWNEVYVSIG